MNRFERNRRTNYYYRIDYGKPVKETPYTITTNPTDDVYIPFVQIKKLKWYEKLWLKIKNWFNEIYRR